MDRRTLLASLAAGLGAAFVFGWRNAEARPRARRRRRVRRRIRRRYRRRVVWRMVNGRRVWVVPVAMAAGWELVRDDSVVIVKETKIVEKEGAKVEVAVVVDSEGKTEEIEIVREDTDENRVEIEGSELPDDDTTTPAVETEDDGE